MTYDNYFKLSNNKNKKQKVLSGNELMLKINLEITEILILFNYTGI